LKTLKTKRRRSKRRGDLADGPGKQPKGGDGLDERHLGLEK